MCGRDDEQDKHTLTNKHDDSGGFRLQSDSDRRERETAMHRTDREESSTTAHTKPQRTKKERESDDNEHRQIAADDTYNIR